jgi:arabinose-5-phosphate isomerase
LAHLLEKRVLLFDELVDNAAQRQQRLVDLRRLLETKEDIFTLTAGEAMTSNPKVIERGALAATAVLKMETHSITSLVVVGAGRRIEGVIHLHDLLKKGIV